MVVAEVIHETADAKSFVLDVPDALSEDFSYRAGQFLTFRVELDGVAHLRPYSMSSSPLLDQRPRVTVKRVPGGVVSNWMNDALAPGDEIAVSVPAGTFVVGGPGGEIVAFAGGSGITPVLSIVRTVLAGRDRPVRLLYANRDPSSAIFRSELEELARGSAGRLAVTFHDDSERGILTPETAREFAAAATGEFFVCGPEPFMDCVLDALADAGVPEARIRLERFTPAPPAEAEAEADAGPSVRAPVQVSFRLGHRRVSGEARPGATLLQSARALGLRAPASCESGSCATCMARIVEGSARMRENEALTSDEVAEGWVLTCQAVPTSPSVRVVYE
ncbi:ferredoxin--NADP reductase [Actinocorallia longicatena]|uniref:Ferredoxin--NADP reductase n=1 Tax=Actinocorallia longicatena TaxID=111803 RepID=A0ABP6Q7A1_9ACTN